MLHKVAYAEPPPPQMESHELFTARTCHLSPPKLAPRRPMTGQAIFGQIPLGGGRAQMTMTNYNEDKYFSSFPPSPSPHTKKGESVNRLTAPLLGDLRSNPPAGGGHSLLIVLPLKEPKAKSSCWAQEARWYKRQELLLVPPFP